MPRDAEGVIQVRRCAQGEKPEVRHQHSFADSECVEHIVQCGVVSIILLREDVDAYLVVFAVWVIVIINDVNSFLLLTGHHHLGILLNT